MPKGGRPENLRPFKPGQSGNPAGRKSAGATIREWVNVLTEKNLTEPQLRKVAKDKRAAVPKRMAALRLLRTIESPDVREFEPFLSGEKTLEELHDDGVDTSVVKSAKITPGKFGDAKAIELHDRSGIDFDRVVEQTDGRPRQAVDVNHDPYLRTDIEGTTAATDLLDRIRQRIGVKRGGTG